MNLSQHLNAIIVLKNVIFHIIFINIGLSIEIERQLMKRFVKRHLKGQILMKDVDETKFVEAA